MRSRALARLVARADDDARRLAPATRPTTNGRAAQLAVLPGRPVGHQGLAEALAVEKRAVARQRLTQLLLGFGAAGRPPVEQLRRSANPAVRRTAIHLLSEFGGTEALPDLTALLERRRAARAARGGARHPLDRHGRGVLRSCSGPLATGTDQTREALTAALVAMRSERAIPLFEYIVRNIDRKGPLRDRSTCARSNRSARSKPTSAVDLLRRRSTAASGGRHFARPSCAARRPRRCDRSARPKRPARAGGRRPARPSRRSGGRQGEHGPML